MRTIILWTRRGNDVLIKAARNTPTRAAPKTGLNNSGLKGPRRLPSGAMARTVSTVLFPHHQLQLSVHLQMMYNRMQESMPHQRLLLACLLFQME
jgi:hypothetical protein